MRNASFFFTYDPIEDVIYNSPKIGIVIVERVGIMYECEK